MLRSRYNNGGQNIDYFSAHCYHMTELLYIYLFIHMVYKFDFSEPYDYRQLSTFIRIYYAFNIEMRYSIS